MSRPHSAGVIGSVHDAPALESWGVQGQGDDTTGHAISRKNIDWGELPGPAGRGFFNIGVGARKPEQHWDVLAEITISCHRHSDGVNHNGICAREKDKGNARIGPFSRENQASCVKQWAPGQMDKDRQGEIIIVQPELHYLPMRSR